MAEGSGNNSYNLSLALNSKSLETCTYEKIECCRGLIVTPKIHTNIQDSQSSKSAEKNDRTAMPFLW